MHTNGGSAQTPGSTALFDPPAGPGRPKVKPVRRYSVAADYPIDEAVDLLHLLRHGEDADALRRVLSVAVLRLDDCQARRLAGEVIGHLRELRGGRGMKPMKQRNQHRPSEGVWGDCHRTAIASILELPLDDVPNFGDGGPDGEEFGRREREFLAGLGLVPVNVAYPGDDLPQVLRAIKATNPGLYYVLGGRSRTGVNHAVVCLDDAIVHDPSQTDAGIIGPCADGFYWVTFFGSAKARAAA